MTYRDSLCYDHSLGAGPAWAGRDIAARIAHSQIVLARHAAPRTPGRDVEAEILRWIASHANGRPADH